MKDSRLPIQVALSLFAALLAGAVFAGVEVGGLRCDWNSPTGGVINDASNWNSVPRSNDTCYVTSALSGPLTLDQPGTREFFGGAMIRYQNGCITNDFGAGNCLTNVGRFAASGLHSEYNAQVWLVSGKMHVNGYLTYDGSFITDDSSINVTGPDSELVSTRLLTLRSNVKYSDQAHITRPVFRVLGGGRASFSNVSIGAGSGAAEGHMVVSGAGSTLTVKDDVQVGTKSNAGVMTNTFVVTDGGRFMAKRLSVGVQNPFSRAVFTDGATAEITNVFVGCDANISNNLLLVSGGAVVTNTLRFAVGSGKDSNGSSSKYDRGGDETRIEGEGSRFVALGSDTKVLRGSRLVVANGGRFEAKKGVSFSSENSAVVTSGTADIVFAGGTLQHCRSESGGMSFEVPAYGRLVGDGGALEIVGNATFNVVGTVALTNVTVTTPYDVVARSTTTPIEFAGSAISYRQFRFERGGAELRLKDTTMTGGRFEFSTNSVLRIDNARLFVSTENDSNGIFILGSGTDKATPRHIYVTGHDAYVSATNANYGGIFFRGTNNTIHVDVPAEGFTTAHPVFETNRFKNEGGKPVNVVITVDPEIVANGGEYVLFKGKNAHTAMFDYTYDPNVVRIVNRGNDGDETAEVVLKVGLRKGIVVIVK